MHRTITALPLAVTAALALASCASAAASPDHNVPRDTPVDAHDDDAPGAHDDSFKDLALKKGTTYVIASSTDETRFRLTVESFDCKVEYPDAAATTTGKPGVFTSSAGKELCVAKVSGKNIGKAPDWAALNYFAEVVDAKKTYYDETTSPNFTTKFLMDGKPALDENVDPGSTGWMVLGYEVPTSAKSLTLRIDTAVGFSH
jgi:hypothetical protein